jgi:hypothetical protein
MLAARSPAPNPQAGGTSGTFLAGLFERLGIADTMRARALLHLVESPNSASVCRARSTTSSGISCA